MDRKENRRKLSGLMVRPHQQIKWVLSMTGAAVLVTTALVILVGVSFKGLVDRWGEMAAIDPELSQVFQKSLMPGLMELLGALFLVAVLMVILLIKSSHRYYGPLVPIQRHIANLIEGNYGSRLNLREGDELTELSDSLNRLAEVLQTGKS